MRISIIILFTVLFNFCAVFDREIIVDNSKLTGRHYRLFQNTPAWELTKAVWDKDEELMEEILSKDRTLINYREGKFGQTILITAVIRSDWDALRLLIKHGADINLHDTFNGSSAIISACKYDVQTEYVEYLIEHGANVNDVQTEQPEWSSINYTPLMLACRNGNMKTVKLLIKHGANINYQDEYGNIALAKAVMQEHYDITLYLLEQGADYTIPLFQRVWDKGQPKIYLVVFLREQLHDLDSKKHKQKMKVVEFLRAKGIEYNNVSIDDWTLKEIKKKYPKNWKEYIKKY
jgi:hypothetical protein